MLINLHMIVLIIPIVYVKIFRDFIYAFKPYKILVFKAVYLLRRRRRRTNKNNYKFFMNFTSFLFLRETK